MIENNPKISTDQGRMRRKIKEDTASLPNFRLTEAVSSFKLQITSITFYY